MPWHVQVAFQGGGARFIQHLAVASAFQDLESDNLIEISRVAGTSAGSLAAAIVASGYRAEDAADILRNMKDDFVRKLGMPSTAGSICRFCVGSSLVNSNNLEAVFQDFWRALTNSTEKIFMTGLSKPLLVTSTNMADRTPKIFGENDEHELIASLVRSCAVPVVFRSVRHLPKEPFVDGGLVENLPLDQLIEGQDKFGDVIGISFSEPKEHQKPDNQIQYLYALYNIASTHNLEHIKKKINRNLIFSIESRIEPLDFETAFTEYGSDRAVFERLRSKARDWIRDRAQAHGPAPAGAHQIWVDEDAPGSTMMELSYSPSVGQV